MRIHRTSLLSRSYLIVALWLLLASGAAYACDTDMVREYKPILGRLNKGLLYVVDDCKNPPNYLFGTIHLDDELINRTAAPAYKAMKGSHRAIFEMQSNQNTQQEIIALMIMPPTEKRTLSDIVGLNAFRTLEKEVQKNQPGFPTPMLERYRPWAASVLVQLPSPTADHIPLDDRLQIAAQKLSLPVVGLESPTEQMVVFTKLTEKEQIALVHDTLNNIAALHDQNAQLKRLYIESDLAGLEALGKKAFHEIRNSKMRDFLRRSLITARNNNMHKNLGPYLAKGGNFIAVGALHLPGESGLLHMLEQDGYYIWPASQAR